MRHSVICENLRLMVLMVVNFLNKRHSCDIKIIPTNRSHDVMTVVGVCQSQWSMSPNAAAVLVGSTATITCHTRGNRMCFIYRENIRSYDPVHVCVEGWDNKFLDRCNLISQSTKGTVTLTLNDVQLSDAGFYSCGNCFHHKTAAAHLLTLGKR